MRPRSISVMVSIIVLAILGTTSPAAALDCVAPPDNSPIDFADGTAVRHDGEPFFDDGNYVVIGRVAEAAMPDPDRAPGTSPPEVVVEVAASIGRTDVGSTVTLDNDPTWGPAYQVGDHHLFIVSAPDRSAQMRIDVCYFGHEIEDAVALADELEPIADEAGTPFSRPSEEADDSPPWPLLAVGVGVVVLGLAALGVNRVR